MECVSRVIFFLRDKTSLVANIEKHSAKFAVSHKQGLVNYVKVKLLNITYNRSDS